jgi:uncharacterized protein YjiS (DUF1127 family)
VGRHRLSVVIALALLAAGCGPTPPQAPGPQAHQLNTALSQFSTACGHAAEVQAFTNDSRSMSILEQQAGSQVPVLARIYKQNPSWIFQGKTVAQLVQMSRTFLDDCGLHGAARRLERATSSK